MTDSKSKSRRVLTGIRASGTVHLGNYLGTIKPMLKWQENHQCLFFIADLHALTTQKDVRLLHQSSLDLVATYIACGLDYKRHFIYRQSDLPMVTELTWYLSCSTGMGLLEKGHAYKDAVAGGREVNHGVLAYPVLMAADILLYDADVVPVGKDQKQHVEMARDMAGSFNALFGEGLLKLPNVSIEESVMVIPGLDGRKMSKSYDNVIPLFAARDLLRKKVLSIKTDSSALEAPKSLGGTLLGDLYKLFAGKEEFKDLESRLSKGGMGWGHAKEALFELIDREVKASREKYEALRADVPFLEKVLADGKEGAGAIGHAVLTRVRKALNFTVSG
jgi:tryptophanyl-tRNA synthetase